MQMQFSGTLKIVSKGRPFTDRTTGEVTPPKFTNFFATQNDDGEPQVFEVKSKADYSEFIDDIVDVTVELFPMREGSGFWASATSVKPADIK